VEPETRADPGDTRDLIDARMLKIPRRREILRSRSTCLPRSEPTFPAHFPCEKRGLRSGLVCSKYRIDFGRGYRVYFGKDEDAVVILLCGGTGKRNTATSLCPRL